MSHRRSPTIRRRLAMLVLAGAAPAVLLAASLLVIDYRSDRETLEHNSIATARAMVHAIDRELFSITAAAKVLATSRRAKEGDVTAFREQALEVVESRLGANVVLSDAEGRQVMNTLSPLGEPLPMHGNPAQLREVFASGKPVISDLYLGGVLRRPVMSIDVPVFRDGKVVYDLSIGEMPERFLAILQEQRLPPGWIGAVFDSNGIIVARTQEHVRFVGQKGAREVVESIARQSEGALDARTLEGIPIFSVFSRSPASGWSVALGIPRQSVAARLWQRTGSVAGAALAILALGLALTWRIGGHIAGSIRALAEPAAQIARREEVIVPPLGLREADEVGAALTRASQMIAAAEHRAQHDPLTGLANRELFHAMTEHQLESCKRSGGSLAVLYIDLDGFKAVNDSLGHEAGDKLLCAVAARLKGAVRGSDVVSRLGGDEFAALLDAADREAAAAIAAKLADVLAAPYDIAGQSVEISASFGVAAYPVSGASAEDLMRHADRAMYKAKFAGKGGYAVDRAAEGTSA